jgi:hypothetical protein
MSGAYPIRPGSTPLRLPRTGGQRPPSGAEFDSAMQQIERADQQSVKASGAANLPGLILTASDGSSWRVMVAADGTLHTVAIARS